MTFAPILALLAATSVVHATAVPRTAGDCTTVHKGYLSANVAGNLNAIVKLSLQPLLTRLFDSKGHLHSFTLNSKNQLTYAGNGKKALKVEFQASSPERLGDILTC
jgi:hypothetical protein